MRHPSGAESGGGSRAGAAEASDRALVQRTLNGDADAFAILHGRYYARVYRLALLRCRSVADAEDAASETFVRAITHLSAFRFQGTSLFPWLARIASNLIADEGRRRQGAAFVSLDHTDDTAEGVRALVEGLPSNRPEPHALAERAETQALVRAAVAALPRDQAEAIMLRFVGELSLKEIAQAQGKTEGAVKSLLHRALVNLRRSLGSGEQEAAVFGHTTTTARQQQQQQLSSATTINRRAQNRAGNEDWP